MKPPSPIACATGIWLLAGMVAPLSVFAAERPEAPFAAMTPEQVRTYEAEVLEAYRSGDRSPATLRKVADLALIPPKLNTSPLPEYDYDQLDYGMTIGIERTPKGRLWAVWVAGEDGPEAFMVAATSDDDGETWSKPRLVVDSRSPRLPLPRSVLVGALWTDPLGRLWFFFDQVMNMRDRRAGLWATVCDNPDAENPEWSEPRRIWHGRMLNKPTVLSTGEWLLPVYLLQTPGRGPFADCVFPELDPYRGANVFVSTDQGATWQRRGNRPFPNPCWHEHMIVERKDGSLWMLARTRKGLMQSFSDDRGATWSEPVAPEGIDHPVARFHLRRLASGRILLVKHGETIDAHEGRSKLTAWLSDDEGATWKGGLMLDERKGISYPDGVQAPDGTLYISYDRERSRLGEILMARITEDDILAGKLVRPNSRLKMLISRPLKGGELLYNGIRLPKAWPPDSLCPQSVEPMPVPYRVHPPAVVPIDVGRQLFVDDFLIEETDLRRTYHTARRYAGNPVMKPETDEALRRRGTVYLGHGGVFFDPEEERFKMFYVDGWRGPLAMAVSPDMVRWTQPELAPGRGNALLPRSVDDNSIWLDLDAPPEERLKYLECHRGRHPKRGHFLYTSADGLTWSEGVDAGRASDYCSFFYNPFRRVWAFSIKRDTRGRNRYYHEHAQFLKGSDWASAVYWTGADRLDRPEPKGRYPGAGEPAQLYSLNAVAYESLMIGMHYIHRGPNNRVCEEGRFPKLT
ncbi:MAG: sialidase family protein, partial [Thermoguttaceae bacterium]